ncbi:Radical SAM superfamily protein [Aquimixticola soesokkakensis]|uniref:Radical SAM superfamily protein n=1 Tax=Aquimixticola soesokkakensis TaxID=1519096 RepID=A0A1Y5SS09_9RHOB|nr:PA0069 family radical SAM protein [Aquimixticola soesokkakensis]SLN46430.1 Radical SAM superfamily protein [Aquimixticola soesokkakensis]
MEHAESSLPLGLEMRARGASTNETPRFEQLTRSFASDGWDIPYEGGVVRTTLAREEPRRVITRNSSPDIPFDRSINPYRGCEHGCTYCFARPTHAWLGLSAGLDFETRLVAKTNVAAQLERELRHPNYAVAPIAIGTNTDPYQPVEAREKTMRAIVQVLSDYNHPLMITTKGTLIERDLDLLAPMARRGLLNVGISLTTLGTTLSRQLEPRAPTPARRLKTIRMLADAGIPVRVMVAPVIPGLSDHELEAILGAARGAGARAASWIMLRLPLEVSQLFQDWLATHVPERKEKVMRRIREMHGGKDYAANWGKRMRGEGEFAELIGKRFEIATTRLGFEDSLPKLTSALFACPERKGDQLSLF